MTKRQLECEEELTFGWLKRIEAPDHYDYYGAVTRGGHWRCFLVENGDYIDLTKDCCECHTIWRDDEWKNYDCRECMQKKLDLCFDIMMKYVGIEELAWLAWHKLYDEYMKD